MRKITISILMVFFIICVKESVLAQKRNNITGIEEKVNFNTNERTNYFSIGWAFTATRYSTGERDFDRPFYSGIFTPGNESQIGFHFLRRWSLITGVNLNVIAINSIPYERGVNAAINRNSVYIHQVSFPLLFALTIHDNHKKFYQQLLTGCYIGKVLNDYYINQNFDSTKGWYESGSYTNYSLNKKFYNLYTGYKLNYRVNRKFHLGFEPYIAYQLKNDVIIENVYNRFLYGFKAGLYYYIKTNQK